MIWRDKAYFSSVYLGTLDLRSLGLFIDKYIFANGNLSMIKPAIS